MRDLFALLFIASCAVNTPAKDCFDDKSLAHVMSSSQRGTLVYVWSPRMVYSVQNASVASRAAATTGLDFVVLHDMRVPDKEIIQGREAAHGLAASGGTKQFDAIDLATPPFVSPLERSQPLCSEQLMKMEALRHFPTAFVITAGGIHPQPVVGAMPLGAWLSCLDQRLKHP